MDHSDSEDDLTQDQLDKLAQLQVEAGDFFIFYFDRSKNFGSQRRMKLTIYSYV